MALATSSSDPCRPGSKEWLIQQLYSKFFIFQTQAHQIQEATKATQSPLDDGRAACLLEQYSSALAGEIQSARDELRRGNWAASEAAHAQYDALCLSLAVWELTHHVVLSSSPPAPRVLHWYNQHYLEEDIAEWWQTARRAAEDKESAKKGSAFWDAVYRLALADCRTEVLDVLQRSMEKDDENVRRICDFLRRMPSLRMMDEVGASEVENRQAVREIQVSAREVMQQLPEEHPGRELLEIYCGSSLEAFEAGKDIASKWARSWTEDLAYSLAWVFPDLRRFELADLLRMVARRRNSENIGDVDKVFFKVLEMDVPGLLEACLAMPDSFPAYIVTHLVDVLYFAGRIPLSLELRQDGETVPPRDFYLIAYSKELLSGTREQQRLAVNYLRAGGSPAATAALEAAAETYCGSAASDAELEGGLDLVANLGLSDKLGSKVCRKRALDARKKGDLATCLRWACRAEDSCEASGVFVSELLDELCSENLKTILEVLTPADLTEPLDRYPTTFLLTLLSTSESGSGERPVSLAPSGRLYFLTQYARCRAMRLAGQPAQQWAPALVRLLVQGVTMPALAQAVLEEDIMPVLCSETPALDTSDTLLLMRYVQQVSSDPFQRVALSKSCAEMHRLLGSCFSRSVLKAAGATQMRYGLSTMAT
eukprot:TRINITY_DN112827_c0_g1_i1.p1 TRINITY_DN112827_c0_g1~~TRINITY_DN112827_c0_g1_i1.p1  ORF type:complete len:689 (-),score=124.36 TRINITY_DN112827_c0_g1_i1:76-2037(-)